MKSVLISILKRITIVYALLFSVISVSAQDLIVTNTGDSLNCKITAVKSDYVYFTFVQNKEVRNTLLSRNQVAVFQYNFYPQEVVPAKNVAETDIYPHLRLAANGGWSKMTAKLSDDIPAQLKTYNKSLMTGYHFAADAEYYFMEQIGIGAEYCSFHSRNDMNNVSFINRNGTIGHGTMSDDITIRFIAPVLSTRFLDIKKKNAFLFNLGIGYLGYTDNAELGDAYEIKGNTLGLCWGIGYDFKISENGALGIQFSYLKGTLNEYKIADKTKTETVKLDDKNRINLNRIDLSVGFRFIK